MVDTFTIHINCNVVLLCYFSLNGGNCCAFAWRFQARQIARWRHCNADSL